MKDIFEFIRESILDDDDEIQNKDTGNAKKWFDDFLNHTYSGQIACSTNKRINYVALSIENSSIILTKVNNNGTDRKYTLDKNAFNDLKDICHFTPDWSKVLIYVFIFDNAISEVFFIELVDKQARQKLYDDIAYDKTHKFSIWNPIDGEVRRLRLCLTKGKGVNVLKINHAIYSEK